MNTKLVKKIDTALDEVWIVENRTHYVERVVAILEWHEWNPLPFLPQELLLWLQKLNHIRRFSIMPTMYYRDYVGIHQQRVGEMFSLSQHLVRYCLGKNSIAWAGGFDFEYATTFSKNHDIIEGVSPFGDIPTPTKEHLSKASRTIIESTEKKLADIMLSQVFFSPFLQSPPHMRQLLHDTLEKQTLEAKLVSYIDKIDGFMTCFHEVAAGNESFREPFFNYIRIIREIYEWKKYPELQPLFRTSASGYSKYLQDIHPEGYEDTYEHFKMAFALFDTPEILRQAEEIDAIIENGFPHSSKTLWNRFHFPLYTLWKNIVMKMGRWNIGSTSYTSLELLTKRRT
jgi:HD containing hydrolase-like enzyme